MNKFKVLAAAIVTFFCGNASAQKVTAENIKAEPNDSATLIISMDGATDIAAVAQFVITLPEGVEVIEGEDEDGVVAPLFERGDMLLKSEQVRVTKTSTGVYGVQIFHLSNRPFKAANGTVLTLPIKIGTLADGQYKGTLTDIGFYIDDKNAISGTKANGFLDDTEFTITVDHTTAISKVSADDLANGKVFNLKGQKVNSVKSGGVYVVNGKKVVVK